MIQARFEFFMIYSFSGLQIRQEGQKHSSSHMRRHNKEISSESYLGMFLPKQLKRACLGKDGNLILNLKESTLDI